MKLKKSEILLPSFIYRRNYIQYELCKRTEYKSFNIDNLQQGYNQWNGLILMQMFGIQLSTLSFLLHNGGADLERLVRETDGYSGSDLQALCEEAAMMPIRELGPLISTITADQELIFDLDRQIEHGSDLLPPSLLLQEYSRTIVANIVDVFTTTHLYVFPMSMAAYGILLPIAPSTY
eukprot:Gb_17301 [translate_table: standard]